MPKKKGKIPPGQITYTTTTGPDGKTVYHPFKAVPASYQTPTGVVSGIQWVPAEATQVLPSNAVPADSDFLQSWKSSADRDREWRRKHDEYRRLVEAKDAGRREGERRKRERDQEQELREAHERDRLTQLQHWGAPSDSGPDHIPTPESPYPTPRLLPLTIDVTIDDSTPVFGLGLFFQPSLETTADDESDSDDEHYIGVIPPSRPPSSTPSDSLIIRGSATSQHDSLSPEDAHSRTLPNLDPAPASEPPLGSLPSQSNRSPSSTTAPNPEPLSPGYSFQNLPSTHVGEPLARLVMPNSFVSRSKKALSKLSGTSGQDKYVAPTRTPAHAPGIENQNNRPPSTAPSTDDEDSSDMSSSDNVGSPPSALGTSSTTATSMDDDFEESACRRLISRAFSPHELPSLIEGIFTRKDEVKTISSLDRDAAQSFIDVVHEALGVVDIPPRLRRKCLGGLCWVCGRHALLPKSLQIPLCYDRSGTPLYCGGFGDVWKGKHKGRHVAVKVLRVYSTSDFDKITSRFCKEVMTWNALRHPNVLQLLGVTMDAHHFSMASEWMVNGNINEFIKVNRDANRLELLEDVARGLAYMHGQAMIHGDLKGANILIDHDCHARLADFGLLTIISDATIATSSSYVKGGTTRWMSPELLNPDLFGFKESRPTKESDCYALGMVVLEVLTGRPPLASDKDFIVMRKIIDGERPGRPEGPEGAWFTDDLWGMLELCWATRPEDRPRVDAALECLERVSRAWEPPSQALDGDVGADKDDLNHTIDSLYQALNLLSPTLGGESHEELLYRSLADHTAILPT